MTNQEAIEMARAAVVKAFPTLDVYTHVPADSADANDPTATLTVYDRAHQRGWVFRCGRTENWLWNADSDIVLPKAQAATLAVKAIGLLQQVPPPPSHTEFFW